MPLNPLPKALTRLKSKTRTGCRTCRIRRVKCDEERPSCRKCASTGRACDGYGIWGGGTNGLPSSSKTRISLARYRSLAPSSSTLSHDEKYALEWLMNRALKKLAGLFGSTFWENLVVQASSTEPATLHALLALSSAYKTEMLGRNERKEIILDEHDKFTLQQYNKAIRHLRVHYSNRNGSNSTTMALIVCMIFTSLEMVRRRYTASNVHLVHGLQLLAQLQPQANSAGGQTLILKNQPDSTYDYIAEVFMRLNSQSVLFGLGSPQIHLEFYDSVTQKLPLMFESVKQARQYLDSLLNRIHHLTEDARHSVLTSSPYSEPERLDSQRRIQFDLTAWLQTYRASLISLKSRISREEVISLPLLRLFHIMATVMASTCLLPHDEMVFDSCTYDFIQMLTQLAEILRTILPPPHTAFDTICQGQGTFTLDMGYKPPLYYMAMKCRHPHLRRLAVRCILAIPHREGFWDSNLIASACKAVIRLEEMGFYSDLKLDDAFDGRPSLLESDIILGFANLVVPTLPESYRIHDPRVILPTDPAGEVRLVYKQRTEIGVLKSFQITIDAS